MKAILLFVLMVFFNHVAEAQHITGKSIPCPGSTETYEFTGVANVCEIIWSVNGGTIIGSQNGTSVQIQWSNIALSGTIYISWKTVVNSTCTNSQNMSKAIDIRVLTSLTASTNVGVPCAFRGNFTFYVNEDPGNHWRPDTYQWSNNAGWSPVLTSGPTNSITYNITNDNAATIQVFGKRNDCTNVTNTVTINVTRPTNFSRVGVNTALKFCSTSSQAIAQVTSTTATSYTWTTDNGATINGQASPVTTTSSSVTIVNPNAQDGTLSVIAHSGCGSSSPITWDLKYRAGAPQINPWFYSHNGQEYFTILPYYSVANNSVPYPYGEVLVHFTFLGATNSYMSVLDYNYPDAYILFEAPGPDQMDFSFGIYEANQWAAYRVTAQNECGSSTYDVAFYAEPAMLAANQGTYAFYPNPTTDELNVEYHVGNTKKPEKRDFDIKLINNKGVIIKTEKNMSENNKIELDIRNVPDGTYFLHITDGKKVIKKQVIVRH